MPWRLRPACSSCGRASGCTCRPRAHGHVHPRTYGPAHRLLRIDWSARVAAGLVDCARCHGRIAPATPWDLGHTDDHTAYSGPEHASCNRAAAARKRNAAARAGRANTLLRPVGYRHIWSSHASAFSTEP